MKLVREEIIYCQAIKGHQDNGIKFSDLSVEAQANVIADKKAKEELRRGKFPSKIIIQKDSRGISSVKAKRSPAAQRKDYDIRCRWRNQRNGGQEN